MNTFDSNKYGAKRNTLERGSKKKRLKMGMCHILSNYISHPVLSISYGFSLESYN